MASASSGSSHLGMAENQKRWLVVGIALNKILVPQIRPFAEQGINTEYNKLKVSHNIDTQSSSSRLQRWPQVLKYENINGNDGHPKLPGGRFNYSLFDCKVTSHVDFARLYVQNHMAHFTAFDDHCDASAVLTLLGRVPAFSAAVQTAADHVREARNDWTHCVFGKWYQTKFQKSFTEMEQLVRAMALPTADEGKLLGELKDWETKGTHLCMNYPVDPALIQLVQQEVKSLQDDVKNTSVECDKEMTKVQTELQNCASILEELEEGIKMLGIGQQNMEHRAGLTDKRVDDVEGRVSVVKDKMSEREGAQTLLVKRKLPPVDKDFMGRQTECEQILHHLSSDSTRIVSIFGPPGFGKSQVVIAVGNDLKFQRKTVYYLELLGVQNKDKLISQIRCNFNVPPNCRDLMGEELLFNLFDQVNGHLYFILDNADKLLEPNVKDDVVNLIKKILAKCPNVTFIVTTRESSPFMQMKSLGQKSIRVGPLGKFYCQNLVQKLLPDSNDDDRKKIMQLCGNVPFAIILMCCSIAQNKKPLNEAVDDFIKSTDRIVNALDNPEEFSAKKLIGIFGSAFESLSSQNDKEAFVSLSVIPGNFDEEVASAVLGKTKAETTLKRLNKRSLLEFSSGSYKIHSLLQSFAMEIGENEMNKVFRNAKTHFYECCISKFKEFLSGKSQSKSAFLDFYEDKDNFVSSLMEGCSENGKTFDKVYHSAIREVEKLGKEAEQCKQKAEQKGELTWCTTEGTTVTTKENQAYTSAREKGKLSFCFGIYQLATGNIEVGVELLEKAFSYFSGTEDQLFKILKVLTCQILSLYYESTNSSERATEFYKFAGEECNTIGDPSLLIMPTLNENVPKEEKLLWSQPHMLAMYFLISKAAQISSPAEIMTSSFALQSHQRTLEIRRKQFGEYHPETADSYHELGVTQWRMNEFAAALQSHQRALDIRLKLLGENHSETAVSYHSLGVTQWKMEDFALALQSHQCALDIRLKLFGENHSETADSYHSLGVTHWKMEDFASALQSHQRALDIRLKLFGGSHSETADSYHELGVTQWRMNELAAALQSHQRALDIRLKLFGKNHSETADSYHSLGLTQWKMEDFAAAVQSHQRALDIRLKLLGGNHSETADSYHELGLTQWKMEDFAAAVQSHQRALDIRLKLFGENHSETADSYHSLGLTQWKMKDFAAAVQSHQRALDIRLKLLGENHLETADSYHELGVTQWRMNELAAALQSHQRALDIRLKLLGENHSETADSYHSLGVTQWKMEDFAAALQSHQRALDIRLKLFGENHLKTADSYHSLGVTQWKMEDFAAALQSHQCALDIRLKLFRENHSETAESYHLLGVTQHEMKLFTSALQSKQRALDIRLIVENHPQTADSFHSLCDTEDEILRIVRKARKFEGEHKDCLRVLPHTYDGQMLVEFYVYRCEPGVPEDLKAAAQEFFGGMNLKLKWSDLYNDASNLLNIVSVDYPSGKAKRLEVSQVDEINEVINKNLALFSKHRSITAVQASFKVTKSKQTEEPCIMVYVLGKGRIPIGESEIPRTVGSYPVDIVDGFWFRTVDPWKPTEGQEQGEVLRLGASIGANGEEACGTLGAVVKDENCGIWYLLSCDHVINRAEESMIIHPGWNDHINFLKYHLNEYRKWIGRITKQTTPLSAECLQEHDKLSEQFKELKALKEEKLKAMEEEVPARSIPPTTFKSIEKHERALIKGFSKLPRIVANYTTGVRCNVEWTDGKEYFIDAAIAELSDDEVESLKLSWTTEIIGTGDYPSGEYTPTTTKAIMNVGELCKSGSVTGYTKSNRLVDASVVAPSFMKLPEYEIKQGLVSTKKYNYYCEKCAKSRRAESVTENVQGSDNFTCKKCEGCMERKASHCESRWLKNCLCIESEKNPFVDKGDSGAVIFEKRDPKQDCLPGFGIVFGELQTAYKTYALASPLEIALKTLSKTVSTTCNLKLVSNCDE